MGKQQSKNARMSAEMKEWELHYSLKSQPVIAVGKKGGADNELLSARGLAIYEPNQLIYIADFGNWRIQVVTFEGNFVTNFGKGILRRPYGVAVTEDHVFVTNYYYQLFQFSDFNVARTDATRSGEGLLTHPRGLCIDYNGDVYVAENINHRVCIYSNELKFINYLGTHQLNYPRDVKVTPNSIVVLDGSPNCVHFFSRNGHLINSCVTQGRAGMVLNPLFFCLDPAGNILITDYSRQCIKILSPSGEPIHAIRGKGHYLEKVTHPFGICISQFGTILTVCHNCINSIFRRSTLTYAPKLQTRFSTDEAVDNPTTTKLTDNPGDTTSPRNVDRGLDPKFLVRNLVRNHKGTEITYPTSMVIHIMGRIVGEVRTIELTRGLTSGVYNFFPILTGHSYPDGTIYSQKHRVIVPKSNTTAYTKSLTFQRNHIAQVSGEISYRYYFENSIQMYVPYTEIVVSDVHFSSDGYSSRQYGNSPRFMDHHYTRRRAEDTYVDTIDTQENRENTHETI
ncbi:PKD domain-containing protein [Oopsacas minuta]|uniref:PKD domain-containing protein n=1 Tax=Oopsacas minuta TaxID=111878 RepID=A0AAV7KF44_9METZ|nr:PKD domain-containing protein [Oopsacas minuta]